MRSRMVTISGQAVPFIVNDDEKESKINLIKKVHEVITSHGGIEKMVKHIKRIGAWKGYLKDIISAA